ncbi:RCC1-like G exchanging factor-like protein isoform X2 [Rhea pennata]|uniref:RCC1-like G exchanging factor-like protein isoform X2 n=1 Tax=Rhea pennata TaxID=8795 RepID=UPI002E276910
MWGALRGVRRPPPPLCRALAKAAGPRSVRQLREADEAAPVFQYVGKAAGRKDRVFVWGFCHSGALGVPSFVKPDAGWKKPRRIQPTPYRLETEEKISSAACGYGFTLLSSNTTDITKVWGMGLNKDSQLGFQRSMRDRTKGYEYVLEPSPIALPLEKPQQTRVLQVSCGRAHSLILTDSEGGLGHYNITSVPTKLRGDIAGVNIIQVTSYGDCCLAVSDEGELFGWGNSEYLQLASVTETTQVNVPRHLPFKIGKIKEAACGGTGNIVLTDEGNVFVWGYGILGKGPNLIETAVPEMIPPSLFGWSNFNPDIRVAHVRCGLSQFAALTNRGELFVWGKNLRGCLGIGRTEDQYFPWRVTVPGEVVDVACGVDHMVSLVKSFI